MRKTSSANFNQFQNIKYSEFLITALILLFVILWITFKLPEPGDFLRDADGGHQLAGANQILFGEHPFIDWRSTYGPLTFYASALAQILTGERIIGEMLLILAGYTLAYVLLFRLLWRASKRRSIAILLTILALILIPRLYKYYIVLGPVVTLWVTWRYVEKPTLRSLWLLALAIAITGLFRPDFGLFSGLVGGLGVASKPTSKFLKRVKRVIGLGGAVVVCMLPWLIWVALKGGLDNYLYDTLFGASTHAAGMALPFPKFQKFGPLISPGNGIFTVFIFFYSLPVVTTLVLFLRRSHISKIEQLQIAAAIVLAQTTLLQSAHRSDYLHLLQSIPISFILWGWLAGQTINQLHSTSYRQRGHALAGLVTFTGIITIFLYLTTSLHMWPVFDLNSQWSKLNIYTDSREKFFDYITKKDPNNWQLQTMQYVRRCTEPSERILALPLLTSFYYLTDRPFGGGQMLLVPGFFSTPDDQTKMIERLTVQDIPLIVNQTDFLLDAREDRKVENFAPYVFDYLNKSFIEVGRYGPAAIRIHRSRMPASPKSNITDLLCPKN